MRRLRERSGSVSPADEVRVVDLLVRDLVFTIGPGHEPIVIEAAARILLFSDGPDDFENRVVDDVQQAMHDVNDQHKND